MSLKLEAIPDRQQPGCPQSLHRALSGFEEGCGEGQDRAGSESSQDDAVSRDVRRCTSFSLSPQSLKVGGRRRPAATLGESGGEARLERGVS